MLGSRLSLGKYLGIGLYVHWTFALLVIYVFFTAQGDGLIGAVYGVGQLLAVFLCVTLHEYGHALAARRFGIPTIDITLLPIGGVARLERMPRIPWQELVVAVAGPLVNVVIAGLILLGFRLFVGAELRADLIRGLSGEMIEEEKAQYIMNLLTQPSMIGFGLTMLAVNTVLVVFNMIPAFPMDGGRVFRSVMAMTMDYRKATALASRVGLVCAALMAGYAIYIGNVMPALIAVFIGYVGIAEARQVEVMESVRGLIAGDAMIHFPPAVQMDTPLWELARQWQTTSISAMPVLAGETVIGVVTLKSLARALQTNVDPNTTAGQLADHDVVAVHQSSNLEDVLTTAARHGRQFPVVDSFGRLVGLLDLDMITARGVLARAGLSDQGSEETFDILN